MRVVRKNPNERAYLWYFDLTFTSQQNGWKLEKIRQAELIQKEGPSNGLAYTYEEKPINVIERSLLQRYEIASQIYLVPKGQVSKMLELICRKIDC